MQENLSTVQALLNIKAGTLLAGLLGALITMLRKSDGSLQARITGYVIAIISVLYFVPFLLWFFDWKFGVVLHSSAENLLSFICGMVSQTLTENFVDDPLGSLYKWSDNFKHFKRVVWNGQSETTKTVPENNSEVEKK